MKEKTHPSAPFFSLLSAEAFLRPGPAFFPKWESHITVRVLNQGDRVWAVIALVVRVAHVEAIAAAPPEKGEAEFSESGDDEGTETMRMGRCERRWPAKSNVKR
jgi:hypothetical protein